MSFQTWLITREVEALDAKLKTLLRLDWSRSIDAVQFSWNMHPMECWTNEATPIEVAFGKERESWFPFTALEPDDFVQLEESAKNSDTKHDFLKDPIKLCINWI